MKSKERTKVYVYLDPRKSGDYEFKFKGGIYRPKFEPFYVGCAKALGCLRHLKGKKSSEKVQRRIRNIFKKDLFPKVGILKEYDDREKALFLEEQLIISIGRRDLKTGPLLNDTDGGKGSKNLNKKICKSISLKNLEIWKDERKRSERTKKLKKKLSDPLVREKYKKAAIRRWKNEDFQKKISEAGKKSWEERYGMEKAEEMKKNMSKVHKGKVISKKTRKKMSESNKGKVFSDETRKKISEALKGRTLSEETKGKISRVCKERKISKKKY